MPENGQAYEMLSQIANLLKSDDPQNPIPPDVPVERVFHAGQSQQGGSIVTYASAFHFPVNDGYFIQAAGGRARPINFGPACGDDGVPPYPDCTPRLTGDQRFVRTDLPVPVYRAQTESDMGSASGEPFSGVIGGDNRQEDSGLFRYYEMAGTAHTPVHEDVEVPGLGITLEEFCKFPLNTLADGPVFGSYLYNAMWQNMKRVAIARAGGPPDDDDDDDDGDEDKDTDKDHDAYDDDDDGGAFESPRGDLLTVVDGDIVRDEFGNALGGIRLPQLDVPVSTYGPNNEVSDDINPIIAQLAGLFCILSGTRADFDETTLDALYPTNGLYTAQITAAADRLADEGFLLEEDRAQLIQDALMSGVGCGIGFELVFVLPPLQWLHRRRRRGGAAA